MPHQVRTDRRRFFKSFLGQGVSIYHELTGRPQHRLSDLWELPNETLSEIKPVVLPGIDIITTEEHVCAKRRGQEGTITLFTLELQNTLLFNHFNGQLTIGQISGRLASSNSENPKEVFLRVKSFFLELVRLGVCAPGNPVARDP